MLRAVHASLPSPTFDEVHRERQQWRQQRERYKRKRASPAGTSSRGDENDAHDSLAEANDVADATTPSREQQLQRVAPPGKPRLQVFTVASHDTAGLRNLQLSAQISGVSLEVLGLGETYRDYSDKLRLFNLRLHRRMTANHTTTSGSSHHVHLVDCSNFSYAVSFKLMFQFLQSQEEI